MKVTIKDIARLAGVSTTTVSRIINNKYDSVGEETKEKVLNLIKELNYKPSSIARSMVTKKTKTIGLILPDISNSFFPNLARGIEDYSISKGYSALLCNSDNNLEKENLYIDTLIEKNVDGIIITTSYTWSEESFKKIRDNGIPLVVLDRINNSNDIYNVYTKSTDGAYSAIKYLIENNHRKIGCITGPLEFEISNLRLEGYKKALKDSGINYAEEYVREADFKIELGKKCALDLLRETDVTAVFACNDMMAIGVYQACKELKLKIPKDISVVGFDNIDISELVNPPLTTVNQNMYSMGKEAAKMLINIIEDLEVEEKNKELKAELVIRESVNKI